MNAKRTPVPVWAALVLAGCPTSGSTDTAALEQRLVAAETALATLQSTADDHESRLVTVEGNAGTDFGPRVTNLETTAAGHTTTLADHGARLAAGEATNSSQDADILALQTASSTYGTDIAAVQTTTGGHGTEIGALQAETAAHTIDIAAIQAAAAALPGPGLFCGASSFTNGNIGGIAGAKTLCETTCGDPAAHMCTYHEVARSRAEGLGPFGPTWFSGPHAQNGAPLTLTNCLGWTSSSVSEGGHRWNEVLDTPYWNPCSGTRSVACCL